MRHKLFLLFTNIHSKSVSYFISPLYYNVFMSMAKVGHNLKPVLILNLLEIIFLAVVIEKYVTKENVRK